jgi:hypothetical protein
MERGFNCFIRWVALVKNTGEVLVYLLRDCPKTYPQHPVEQLEALSLSSPPTL